MVQVKKSLKRKHVSRKSKVSKKKLSKKALTRKNMRGGANGVRLPRGMPDPVKGMEMQKFRNVPTISRKQSHASRNGNSFYLGNPLSHFKLQSPLPKTIPRKVNIPPIFGNTVGNYKILPKYEELDLDLDLNVPQSKMPQIEEFTADKHKQSIQVRFGNNFNLKSNKGPQFDAYGNLINKTTRQKINESSTHL